MWGDVHPVRFQHGHPDRTVAPGETKKSSQAAADESLFDFLLIQIRGERRRQQLRQVTRQRNSGVMLLRADDLDARAAVIHEPVEEIVVLFDEPGASAQQISTRCRKAAL